MRIGIVAGEESGDQLGEGLITAIKKIHPNAVFEGIAGRRMIKAGCKAIFSSEKLAVMGLVEVLGHLPEILKIRKQLLQYYLENPPDVFIGIDAPDFNLPLECKLKTAGIKTVHYVSPQIWAWRQKRVKKFPKCIDLILCIFPFEIDFFQNHNVNARFVGHPLADDIAIESESEPARDALGINREEQVLALLPGSRAREIQGLADSFLKAANICRLQRPDLKIIVALANQRARTIFEEIHKQSTPELDIQLVDGRPREVIAAANVVLVASGTATLETLLLKRPMVVAYKLSKLTYWMFTKLNLVKISLFSQPNLLAGKELVKELIQDDATPENMADAIQDLLANPERVHKMNEAFTEIHKSLRKDASQQAANAVMEII